MGAAGSIEISSITEDKYDESKLKEMFKEGYDEEVFKEVASSDGFVSRDELIHLYHSHSNMYVFGRYKYEP
jgi:hypothetical protein